MPTRNALWQTFRESLDLLDGKRPSFKPWPERCHNWHPSSWDEAPGMDLTSRWYCLTSISYIGLMNPTYPQEENRTSCSVLHSTSTGLASGGIRLEGPGLPLRQEMMHAELGCLEMAYFFYDTWHKELECRLLLQCIRVRATDQGSVRAKANSEFSSFMNRNRKHD